MVGWLVGLVGLVGWLVGLVGLVGWLVGWFSWFGWLVGWLVGLVGLVGWLVGWLAYGILHHFQQYLRYIVAVSFIGGGNRSTWRKPLTCRKSLKNVITYDNDHDGPNCHVNNGYFVTVG